MNDRALISATLTTPPAQGVQAERPIVLWVLAAAFVIIAAALLVADASLSPAQRIAVYMQTGMFP